MLTRVSTGPDTVNRQGGSTAVNGYQIVICQIVCYRVYCFHSCPYFKILFSKYATQLRQYHKTIDILALSINQSITQSVSQLMFVYYGMTKRRPRT